jgi:hypothetical protein
MSVTATGLLTATQVRRVTLILTFAAVLIVAAFIAARLTHSITLADWLDNLHWTIAYVTAAVFGWLGVRWSDAASRNARRWFAYGLTPAHSGNCYGTYKPRFTGTAIRPPPTCCFYASVRVVSGACCTPSAVTSLEPSTGL